MTQHDPALLERARRVRLLVLDVDGVLTDDDTHFEAIVIATQFEGKRSIQRHQLVYAGLGARMGREVHALSIQAYTPAEWQAERGGAEPR